MLNHPLNKSNKILALVKIILWKINQLTIKMPAIITMHDNVKLICKPNSSYAGLVVYTKLPEYEEMMFMYNYTKPSDTIIDVGANIGAVSVLLASKLTTGRLYAFEPTLIAYNELIDNIELNNQNSKVVPEKFLVSNRAGTESFYLGQHSETNSLISDNESISEKIKSTTLDLYCERKKIKHVNLLKIDVEGAEPKVLEGSARLLKNALIDTIVLEINPRSELIGYTEDYILKLLKSYKYSIFSIKENGEILNFKKKKSKQVYNVVAIRDLNLTNSRLSTTS